MVDGVAVVNLMAFLLPLLVHHGLHQSAAVAHGQRAARRPGLAVGGHPPGLLVARRQPKVWAGAIVATRPGLWWCGVHVEKVRWITASGMSISNPRSLWAPGASDTES